MKRRDVLTTTAAIAFAGCLGGGNNGSGGNTDNGSETADGSPTGDTETQTSATGVPTATETSTPHTVQTTEPKTKTNTATPPTGTATPPTDTTTETATETTDTPIPIPDRPTDHRKDTPLTGEAHVAFKDGGSRIVVSGTVVGENGCLKPVLDSVQQTNSGLVITIATKRDAPSNALCSMALVELDYRFPVTVETPPKSVTVIHRGVTGKRTMTTVKPGG